MMTLVLKAIYDNLLPYAVGGWTIHNVPPMNTPLPYMVFGYTSRREWGAKPCTAESGIFTTDVHLWTAPHGFKEMNDKMDEIIPALKSLSEAGLTVGKASIILTPLIVEDDAIHGIIRMEYKIMEV
jgi:hypothetical protein